MRRPAVVMIYEYTGWRVCKQSTSLGLGTWAVWSSHIDLSELVYTNDNRPVRFPYSKVGTCIIHNISIMLYGLALFDGTLNEIFVPNLDAALAMLTASLGSIVHVSEAPQLQGQEGQPNKADRSL